MAKLYQQRSTTKLGKNTLARYAKNFEKAAQQYNLLLDQFKELRVQVLDTAKQADKHTRYLQTIKILKLAIIF